jgi:hypothetical protein
MDDRNFLFWFVVLFICSCIIAVSLSGGSNGG